MVALKLHKEFRLIAEGHAPQLNKTWLQCSINKYTYYEFGGI